MLGKWSRHHLTFPESSSTVLTFLDPSSSSINFPPRDRGSPQGWGGGGRGGGRRRRFQWWRLQQWCGFQHRLGMRWVWAGVGTNPKFWLAISWFLLRWNTHPIFLYFSVGLDPQALLNNSMGTDASNDSDRRSWEKWLIRGLKFGCLRFLQSFCSQQALSNMILWKSAIAIFTLVFFSFSAYFVFIKKCDSPPTLVGACWCNMRQSLHQVIDYRCLSGFLSLSPVLEVSYVVVTLCFSMVSIVSFFKNSLCVFSPILWILLAGSDTGISEEAMTPVNRTLGGLGYYCPWEKAAGCQASPRPGALRSSFLRYIHTCRWPIYRLFTH